MQNRAKRVEGQDFQNDALGPVLHGFKNGSMGKARISSYLINCTS
jgi:hypothetical protein